VSPDQPHLTPLRSVLIGVKDLLQTLLYPMGMLKSREMRDHAQRAARPKVALARTHQCVDGLACPCPRSGGAGWTSVLIERSLNLRDPQRGETRTGQFLS
jgi:hypothetical protein